MGLAVARKMSFARLAREFDPRLKIFSAFAAGICVLKAWWPVAAVFFILLLGAARLLRSYYPSAKSALKAYGVLILFWMALKMGVGVWEGLEPAGAAYDAAILGIRLSALFLAGLVLAMSTSARSLGGAFSWFLKPVMGKNSWQGALALSLFVHFLPHSWQILSDILQSVSKRCPDLGFFRKALVVAQALIRCLSQMVWKQTLAVAARRLDDADAWQLDQKMGIGQLLPALGFCFGCLWLAFV